VLLAISVLSDRLMSNGHYIAVEGPIGVGKTSLARILSEHYYAQLTLEHPEENPFLPDFYRDPARWALETQLIFLLSRHRQQSEINQVNLFHQSIVSDYIIEKDGIFARLNLNERELQLYYQIAKTLTKDVPVPDLVIFLKASVDRLVTNIRVRNIPYESFIEKPYLEDLCSSYNSFFKSWDSSPVLVVNTNEIDFVNNPSHKRVIIKYIELVMDEKFKGTVEVSLD